MIAGHLAAATAAARPASGGGYTGPLDLVPGAVVAFGQRAMSSALLGSALYTIRRDSDNATQSFSSDATTGAAPAASVAAFLGAAGGFVTTLNLADGTTATQATAADQPQIFPTAPSIGFGDGSVPEILLATPLLTLTGPSLTVFATLDVSGSTVFGSDVFGVGFETLAGGCHFSVDFQAPDQFSIALLIQDAAHANGWTVSTGLATAAVDTSKPVIIEAGCDGTDGFVAINGTALAATVQGHGSGVFTEITEVLAIGNDDATGPASPLLYDLRELEVYAPLLMGSSDRLALRQNIATYYGITLS